LEVLWRRRAAGCLPQLRQRRRLLVGTASSMHEASSTFSSSEAAGLADEEDYWRSCGLPTNRRRVAAGRRDAGVAVEKCRTEVGNGPPAAKSATPTQITTDPRLRGRSRGTVALTCVEQFRTRTSTIISNSRSGS